MPPTARQLQADASSITPAPAIVVVEKPRFLKIVSTVNCSAFSGGWPRRCAPRLPERRKDAERLAVEEALKKAGNNKSVAARILGVSRRTLYNKLEVLGLTEALRSETLRHAAKALR